MIAKLGAAGKPDRADSAGLECRVMWRKALAVTISMTLTLLAVEGAARLFVWARWPEGRVEMLTRPTPTRGRYATDPTLGYRMAANFEMDGFRHNSLGFRGEEFPPERIEGVLRIALLGGSTVYGPQVRDEETSASRLEELLRERGIEAEVINAGVPGWNSRETLLNWRLAIRPLAPDVLVIVDGRNEVFPQLWNAYRDDYQHFRDPQYQVVTSNAGHKPWFRASHLLMWLVTRADLLGFEMQLEHPAYGSILFANKPSVEQAEQAAVDPERVTAFVENLRTVVSEASSEGILTVLATMPHWAEGFVSGTLPGHREGYIDAITLRVLGNNEEIRELGRELGVPVAEGEALSSPEYLVDDCHFTPEGEAMFAGEILKKLEPLLPRAAAPLTVEP